VLSSDAHFSVEFISLNQLQLTSDLSVLLPFPLTLWGGVNSVDAYVKIEFCYLVIGAFVFLQEYDELSLDLITVRIPLLL
jgi:hypothetical protein